MILGLFFTRGVSLKTWMETGLFGREKLLYETYLKYNHFSKIILFTYGSDDENIAKVLKRQGQLHNKIEIIPMPNIFDNNIGELLYSFILPLWHVKKCINIDVFKTNQMDGSWAGVIAKLLYGKPLVVRCGYELFQTIKRKSYNNLKILIIYFISKISYIFSDIIILPSKNISEFVHRSFRVPKVKIKYHSNYVDTELFKPIEILEKRKRVLFVGRLSEEKNILSLIEACKNLGVGLDIIGDGVLKDYIKNYIQSEEIIDVKIIKSVGNDQLPYYMNSHIIFVLPSFYEGNPKVLLEAMACGMAVVGTDVPGINNIIFNNVNGILCNTGSKSIEEALESLYNNPEKRKRLGISARKYILKNCSLNSYVKFEFSCLKML